MDRERRYSRTFEWRFDSPPAAVWPALADTQRFNEAAGLPKHRIREELQADGSVRFLGKGRLGPFELEWEDFPVEWVDRQWFRHLRLFHRGPFRELCASLRLQGDSSGGSVAHYTLEAVPAHLFGSAILAGGFFGSVDKKFRLLATSARDWAAGRAHQPFRFDPPPVDPARVSRLESMVARIDATPHGHGLSRRLGEWVLQAQEVDLTRIRPVALARLWSVEPRHMVELCLQAVREGLLELRWDLLCPRCRGAKLTAATLDQLPHGAHCATCNISYDREFSRNVELTFRPSPSIRGVADGEFCLFGPMSTPHVKVQVTVGPGQERVLPAELPSGHYRIRTIEAGDATEVVIDGTALPDVRACEGTVAAVPAQQSGEITFRNGEARRLTFVVEAREWVQDAITADRATALQAFRDLFSDQVLRPGDDVSIASVTLMFTDLKGSTALYERVGDATAYHLVREHFAFLAAAVREHNGAIVKTIGDAVMAAFAVPGDAVRAALAIQEKVRQFELKSLPQPLTIKMGLHTGPCIGVTLNDRLDYFGGTVNMAARLQQQSDGNDIVLSEALAHDPEAEIILADQSAVVESRTVKGFDRPVTFHRVRTEIPRA